MPTFFRYLVSLIAHMAWSRVGKGPVPPIRLPRRGPVALPPISPWQIMLGFWLVGKVWERYGRDVKATLRSKGHPAVQGVANWLPDPQSTSAAPAPALAAPDDAPLPPAASTQPLPGQVAATSGQSTRKLSGGSLLASLRRPFSSHNQPSQG